MKQCWGAAKHLIQYLKGSIDYEMIFDRSNGFQLGAYSDSDWAGDLHDRKSTTGSCIMLAGGPVFWKSTKQTGMSLSSIKTEYIAASETAKSIIVIQEILIELDIIDEEFNFSLMIDNEEAITIGNDEKITRNACHIEICYHHIHDLVQKKTIELLQISSNEMTADDLTKSLKMIKFQQFRSLLDLCSKNDGDETDDNEAQYRAENRAENEVQKVLDS